MVTIPLPRRTGRCLLFTLLLGAAAALAPGCASTGAAKKEIVWPLPPEKPRIKHLRSFGSADDLDPSAWSQFARALVPSDSRAFLKSPNALALSPDEKVLYASNPAVGTLVRVDLEAASMKLVGDGGPNRLVQAFGVGLDADANVYVADHLADSVVVLDKDGGFVRRFGNGILEHPTNLAIDRRAQLVYVVNGSASLKTDHRIEVFSLQGKHLRTIGTRGHSPGEFNFPTHIAVDPNGQLYVSDMLNFRVQVFDRDGRLQTLFGTIGAGGAGQFDKSKGIAFDTFGNVYVADALHGVQIFNRAAQPLLGFGEGVVQMPTGLVIDSRNHIYVSDPPSARIHEFVLFNTTAEDSNPQSDKTESATHPKEGVGAPQGQPKPPRDG